MEQDPVLAKLPSGSVKRALGAATAGGFIGSSIFLIIMFTNPVNPFAIFAATFVGLEAATQVAVQPAGWFLHTTIATVWGTIFGWMAWAGRLRQVYWGALAWGLVLWVITLLLILSFGLLNITVAVVELMAHIVYSLVLAAAYLYGVFGTFR